MKHRIILDIETNIKHDRIWLCVTKDIDTQEIKVWKAATDELRTYLKGASLIIMHNGVSFDAPILNQLWKTKIVLSQCFDTLLVSRLLNPSKETGHSLEAWGEELKIGKINYKAVWLWLNHKSSREISEGDEFNYPHQALMEDYCIRDVNVTHVLYDHLLKEIAKDKVSQKSIDLEHKVGSIVAKMVRNGFKLDTIQATMLLADLQTRKAELVEWAEQRWPTYTVERYSEKTGKRLKDSTVTFNLGSRQQIGDKLKELGWKPEKFTETGQAIVDEDVLSKLPYDEAKKIAEYLLVQKRIAQVESWMEVLGHDGRVHGKVITNGAVTGRATHSSPNMAQVPAARAQYGPECRKCWTVDAGSVLVGCDLSGIELRCFAHYLNDPEYTNEVVNGDVHTRNQHAFGVATRDQAKTVLYATLYGASPAKIGKILGSSSKEGERIIKNFDASVPAYAALKRKIAKFAEKKRLPGLDGRKLHIRSEHSALNTLLQSAGAIIAKQWLVCIEESLRKQKIPYKLVAWVHDEVQIETPKEFADEVGKIAVDSAAKAGTLLDFRCPVGAEYKVGANWYECH